MKTSQIIGLALLTLIVVLGLGWIAEGNDFFLYKAFAPKYEAVRRQTFEQTKSYNQGMVQQLQKMQLEYISHTGDTNVQSAMASVILQQAADYPEASMPDSLRTFIRQLKLNAGLIQ